MLGKFIVGDPAREVDALGDAILLQGGCDRFFKLPVPADERAKVLLMDKDCGQSLGEMLDALLSAQPADVADEGRAVGKWGGDGEDLEVEEVLVGDEDLVAVGFEMPFGDDY